MSYGEIFQENNWMRSRLCLFVHKYDMLGMLKLQGSGWTHDADDQCDGFVEKENSEHFSYCLKKSTQNHLMASEISTRAKKLSSPVQKFATNIQTSKSRPWLKISEWSLHRTKT